MIVVLTHFSPIASSVFVGTKVEGVIITVLVAFWTAIVAINTDANDGLAPVGESSNAVQNANLYYFSWAGFIVSIVLLVSFLRDAFGLDVLTEVRNRGARLHHWAIFFACATVVMGSASRTLNIDCPDERDSSYCRKTKYAIAAGTLSFVIALLVIASKILNYVATTAEVTPFLVEFGSSIFVTIINAFGVGFTTSADGPGSEIGNLYYFSWGIFLLSAMLMAECYNEFTHPPQPQAQENGDSQYPNGTLPDSGAGGNVVMVEQFDDTI